MRDSKELSELRHVNRRFDLNAQGMAKKPLDQIQKWLDKAIADKYYQANAMTLSTVNSNGQPAARIVLLKEITNEGLVFYTNYESRKAKELEENPKASLLFYWDKLERQIRIEGIVSKIPEEKSNQYFKSRPRESQLGAIASPQSKIINSREWLDARYQEIKERYDMEHEIQRPKSWGGFCLEPTIVEFWQGRPSRLHDRLAYMLNHNKEWQIVRLSP